MSDCRIVGLCVQNPTFPARRFRKCRIVGLSDCACRIRHCPRDVGLSEEKISAIPTWSTSEVFAPKERAVLAYTDELVLQNGRVQDVTFERLQEHLSDEEILELSYITALYEMHAILTRALRLEYDDIDERIVEIAAPESGGDADFMGGVGSET